MKTNYFDTDPASYADSRDAFMEDCEFNDLDPGTEDFNEWCARCARDDFDDFLDNLRYSKENDRPCIITGTLGLWDGRHEVIPVEMETLEAAVKRCIGESTETAEGFLEDGVFTVKARHHDGTNVFTISPVGGKYPEQIY